MDPIAVLWQRQCARGILCIWSIDQLLAGVSVLTIQSVRHSFYCRYNIVNGEEDVWLWFLNEHTKHIPVVNELIYSNLDFIGLVF